MKRTADRQSAIGVAEQTGWRDQISSWHPSSDYRGEKEFCPAPWLGDERGLSWGVRLCNWSCMKYALPDSDSSERRIVVLPNAQ